MDNGHLTLNLMSLAVLYSFAGLVGGTSGIILIFINKREIESLRNLVADNVNGRYEKMDLASCKLNKNNGMFDVCFPWNAKKKKLMKL